MIKVESGMMVPLAEPFPNLAPGLPGEASLEDEESNTAAWVNQCIETGGLSLDPALDLESLFGSLASANFPASTDLMDVDPSDQAKTEPTNPAEVVERPAQPVTPVSVPASPASSDSSYHRSTNPLPRHKRPSHKRAELKRRDKIKNRLDDLKAEVPSIADKGKMSESAILSKAAEYVKHLKGDCERFTTEAGNLRQEIESLSTEIHTFQEHLPATGLKPEGTEGQDLSFDQLYETYVAQRTKDNWKFYLFSFFMKPLFKSYKEETATNSLSTFVASVTNWTRDNLGLSTLRPKSLEIMREICKETDIMNHPETLRQQALASVGRTATSTAQPTMEAPRQPPKSVPSQPQVSPPFPTPAHPPVSPPFPTPAQPPVSPSFPTPSQPIAASPRERSTSRTSSEAGLPIRDRSPKLRTVSPRNLLPTTSRPALSRGRALSASPPKHFKPLSSQQLPSQPALVSTSARSTVPEATVSLPGQHSAAILPAVRTPTNFVTLTPRPAATQQAVGAGPSHADDVTQLAASVGETTLRHGPPTPAVVPNMVIVPEGMDSKVAQFTISGMAGTNCHFYDFDLTDIPLPELPDSFLPSPQPIFTAPSPFTCLTTIEAFPHGLVSVTPSFAQATTTTMAMSHSASPTTTPTTTATGVTNPPTSTSWS